MKCEIREIYGDWALDVFDGGKVTIFFNSRQNALNVKRILEVDASIPNAATVCDMQEVKHGVWIEGKNIEKCSICGKKGFSNWRYCPGCGARMDGDEK